MKLFSYLLLTLLILASCEEKKEVIEQPVNKTENKSLSLEGTWELIGYYNYQGNEVVNVFEANDDVQQIKMYTKGHFMWSKKVPKDSTEWHGFGTYVQTDSTLSETVKYGSAAMQNLTSVSDQFFYQLELDKNSYSQIVTDDEGYRIYSENYKRID
ncbi:hypothetical protein [Paucihalobacter sp.]|uniref:hypothetical protein n=1 Tax=Paucihalobacter sp. TaxID=2850405 RepID=UPI002FDFC067